MPWLVDGLVATEYLERFRLGIGEQANDPAAGVPGGPFHLEDRRIHRDVQQFGLLRIGDGGLQGLANKISLPPAAAIAALINGILNCLSWAISKLFNVLSLSLT